MSDKDIKVTTPVGFIEILITIGANIPLEKMDLVRTGIRYPSGKPIFLQESISVPIGESSIQTLKPGKYKIEAFFGQITSEDVEVEVLPGEVTKLNFHFGKEEE